MNTYKIKKPFVLIIFGASGDLARLKLFPALYSLIEQNRLPEDFHIIGYARSKKTDKEFQKEFIESIKKNHPGKIDPKLLNKLSEKLSYFTGNYDNPEDFHSLRNHINKLTNKPSITKIAYFSVPPFVFKDLIKNLGETRKNPNEDLRLVIEKPFGKDAETARELFHYIARYFNEDNIYLLDHYLGKTAVQSILSLRHHNRLLNQLMKGPQIANIQITAAENIGVTTRAGYFDEVGTVKDMMQSHLLQILALITMSIPISENPESLQREKYSILSALKFIESPKNLVLGQYQSYKSEKGITKNSQTETFAALRLFIDRESWYKRPIYIRTGKKLHEKHTYIVIELKKFAFQDKKEEPNRLIIELQPQERIIIKLVNKYGSSTQYQDISTADSLACIGDNCLPEHGLLILDVMRRERLNFLSFNEIIASWQITDCIIKYINKTKLKPEKYKDGTPGPESQNQLTKMDGFEWYDLN